MVLKKSPSGAIFPYPYKGGELFGIHSGSYYANEEDLIAILKAEAQFFLDQHRKMGIWLDLYEDKLSDRVLAALIEYLLQVKPRITKVALVGCSFRDKGRINKLLQKTEGLSSLPVKYYKDPEEAKTWLVSEGG